MTEGVLVPCALDLNGDDEELTAAERAAVRTMIKGGARREEEVVKKAATKQSAGKRALFAEITEGVEALCRGTRGQAYA